MRKMLLLPQLLILGLCGQLVLTCQTRKETPPARPNPYSKLKNQELADSARKLVTELRSLNKEFRTVTDGISAGDREAKSKLASADMIQSAYERKFSSQARDLESELLKRLPSGGKPKDVPSEIGAILIKSGKLIGADPANAIASYLEELAKRLPK
jgi:hypothetical protein